MRKALWSWYLVLFVVFVLPRIVFAQASSDPVYSLPGGEYVERGLALGAVIQGIARLFAEAGYLVNKRRSGRGSGWFRFWNRVATFPGKVNATVQSGETSGG